MSPDEDRAVIRVPSTPAQLERVRAVARRGQVGLLAHCLTVALEITGPVEPAVVQRGLDFVVSRHPALRSVFPPDGVDHLVLADTRVRLARVMVAGPDPSSRWDRATEFATADRMRPFDLATGPLVRATLLSTERHRHLLVLSFDQLVTDARSAVLVINELVAAADADLAGVGPPEADIDRYCEVLDDRDKWSRAAPAGDTVAQRDDVHHSLPWSPAPDMAEPGALAHRMVPLRDETSAALLDAARRMRVIPFAMVLAAFRLVIGRSGDGFGVTSMFANRPTTRELVAVGWLANRVPVVLPELTTSVELCVRAAHARLMRALRAERMPWSPAAVSGVSVSVLYLSAELSGADQDDLRMGAATVRRLAVSFCPTGADIDLFVVENAALLSGGRARLALGGMSARHRVGQDLLDTVVNQWAAAAELLAHGDPQAQATDLVEGVALG